MKIAQLTPGSGDNFYCENCLRDASLVQSMRRLDLDVLMIPMYLPLQTDKDTKTSNAPIFFGGINVYLQQKLSLFRKTPRWLDWLFDRPGLLEWVGKMAGMTSAKDLGETTMSMLRGEDGRQEKELDRLITWLKQSENKPDVVCLSNALLAGLAKRIKERLNVPVVCLLQDEDGFLDGLAEPYSKQAWDVLARRVQDVDVFIAVSRYYAGVMQKRLKLDTDRVHVVYTGIPLEGYEQRKSGPKIPTIGFLSRMCSDKGLDTLIEAFITLKQNEGLENIRLIAAGGKTSNDEAFLGRIKQRLKASGFIGDVEFCSGFERNERLDFFRKITVLSVPEKKPVAYGLYVLEALAAGVPFVEPDIGVFSELLEMTGGGVLYEPGGSKVLADKLKPFLLDAEYALELGAEGKRGVTENFDIKQTAQNMVRIYEQVIRRS